jgi:hypothetical protein
MVVRDRPFLGTWLSTYFVQRWKKVCYCGGCRQILLIGSAPLALLLPRPNRGVVVVPVSLPQEPRHPVLVHVDDWPGLVHPRAFYLLHGGDTEDALQSSAYLAPIVSRGCR